MKRSLAESVLREMQQGRCRAGDRVGVAVSGGGDSVALLLLLEELREKLGLVLCVLHLNHRLRGRQSDADERFTAKLAKKFGFEFFCRRVKVRALAKKQKHNLEDAARRIRYEWFLKIAAEQRLSGVATAHTADDQAETILGHLLRGTGLAGLSGIHRTAGLVFRPLLGVRRRELREYLKKHKQAWREDRSNRDLTKTRARVRRKLIPLLERDFQPLAVKRLTDFAEHAHSNEVFLNSLADSLISSYAEVQDGLGGAVPPPVPSGSKAGGGPVRCQTGEARIGIVSLLTPLKGVPAGPSRALSIRLIGRLAASVKPGEGQLTSVHFESVLRLAESSEPGKMLELPGGLRVCRETDSLLFCRAEALATPRNYAHQIEEFADSCAISVPQLQCAFRFTVIDWPCDWRDTNLIGTVLDRDRLKFPLVLRNWWPGDRMHPVGRQGSHKLKHLLTELRLSKWQREGWPVLASAEKVAWARGLPVDVEFAPGQGTRTGMVIAVEAGSESDRRAAGAPKWG